MTTQKQLHADSIAPTGEYWRDKVEQIKWTKKPTSLLKTSSKGKWQWFEGGEMNMCYECIDVNVEKGLGEVPAIIWDSPVTNSKARITYSDLLDRVQRFAGVMKDMGVKKGDVVMIYMPMIPEALVGMYACARLGAIHSVVFGGFASRELAKRIDAATPKLILTASAGVEEKRTTPYLPLVKKAIEYAKHKPEKTIMYQRPGYETELPLPKNFLDWDTVVSSLPDSKKAIECTPTRSDHEIYTLYTSGTTGAPKGVSRFSSPYAVHLKHSISTLMNLQPKDVMFCASDIGWVVGHTYIVYAPLLGGCTSVLFEGKVPMRDGKEVWRICEEHKVNVLFCAPTALRALRSSDPQSKEIKKRNLKHLRNLMLAGERSEPSIVEYYAKVLGEQCGPEFHVIDNYWSSESGSPITGILQHLSSKPAGKPGSAGPPTPGYDVRIVDDSGIELPANTEGNIVLKTPLPPSMCSELWRDTNGRFEKSYMKRFDGRWFDTGDAGKIDSDGFVHIMSRSDDIINVAAHRLSTGAFEAVITSIPGVAECCVVGLPDPLKGHVPLAFIVSQNPPSFETVNKAVREEIGNIASLAGIVVLKSPLPKTRSGKTLRRVVRGYVENVANGTPEKAVDVPATIEDPSVLGAVQEAVIEFFKKRGGKAKL